VLHDAVDFSCIVLHDAVHCSGIVLTSKGKGTHAPTA
jgi:hypothetical protein